MKQKLILVCDTKNEIDDQFAISYAINSNNIDLIGIVSTQNVRKDGLKSVDVYHEEAQKIVSLCSADISCFRGMQKPLQVEQKISDGAKFIIEKCLEHKEQLIVGCTGPLTDIAQAMRYCPEIVPFLNVIWLGGFSDDLTASAFHHRELNFLGDTLAAREFFDSLANISYLPAWGVADSLVCNSMLLRNKLVRRGTPISNYLADLIDKNWQRFGIFNSLVPQILKRYWVFFDIGVVAVAEKFGINDKCSQLPTIIKNRYHFEHRSTNSVTIKEIDHLKILARMEELVLK